MPSVKFLLSPCTAMRDGCNMVWSQRGRSVVAAAVLSSLAWSIRAPVTETWVEAASTCPAQEPHPNRPPLTRRTNANK